MSTAIDLLAVKPGAVLGLKRGTCNGIDVRENKTKTGFRVKFDRVHILKIPFSPKCALAKKKEDAWSRGVLVEVQDDVAVWFAKMEEELVPQLEQFGLIKSMYPEYTGFQVTPTIKDDGATKSVWFNISYNKLKGAPDHCVFFKKDNSKSVVKTDVVNFEKAVQNKCGAELAVVFDDIYVSQKEDGVVVGQVNFDVYQICYQELVPQVSLFETESDNTPVLAGPWANGPKSYLKR